MQGIAQPGRHAAVPATGGQFSPEFEAKFQAARGSLWTACLEYGFTTHPGDTVRAVDEASAMLAESDARLIRFVEDWIADALAGAR